MFLSLHRTRWHPGPPAHRKILHCPLTGRWLRHSRRRRPGPRLWKGVRPGRRILFPQDWSLFLRTHRFPGLCGAGCRRGVGSRMGAGSGEAFCLKKPDPCSGGSQDPKDHEKDEDADHALAFSLLLASGYVCTAAGIVVFKLHWITSNRIFKPFSAGRAFYPSVSLFHIL